MAPCFIGDAGVLHNCRRRLFGVSCLVALFVFALGVCCGLARSLLALLPPISFGWSSAFWSSQCSVGPFGHLVVFARSIALALASTRMRKLWYGVLWLIGSCLHSSSWQQRLRPCPVWFCALHHVGVLLRCLSLLH